MTTHAQHTAADSPIPVVAVVAYSPAPYRVELFDEIARRGIVRLQAIYVHRHEPGRHWAAAPLHHTACFLREPGAIESATQQVRSADLAVISYFSDPAASSLWRERRATRKPWVFWGERPGAYQRGAIGRIVRRFRLRHLRSSEAPVWAIGNWAALAYREEFGPHRRVENLPYYSDLARFAKAATTRNRAAGQRRILFSGSFIARKGVDLLLNAFAVIAARHSGLTLTLAGAGELETRIKQQVAAQALRVRVEGFTPWEKLPELYAEHDVLAVPSRYDGWGMVVPEGLASGMPVLATDHMGAALDLITRGSNGWICTADDTRSLAQNLEQAASLDPVALNSMSAAATASVARHQLQDGARKFEELCLESLRPSSAK